MRKFSKQILKSFKYLSEADDGGSPKGQPTVQNTPQEQMQLYHGQGGMSGYITRTQSNIPQWMYTGIPAYTSPQGIVIIPPDPRTGIFLPNMLPNVHLVHTPGPWGVHFYTFDFDQLGGMNATNAYNFFILNIFTNPEYVNLLFNGTSWGLNNIDLVIASMVGDIRDAINQGVPGFNQGDNNRFSDAFFASQKIFFDFMAWWGESWDDLQNGNVNWDEIEFPGNSQS